MSNKQSGNLDIPDFLKRTGSKVPVKEVQMSDVSTDTKAKKTVVKADKTTASKAPAKAAKAEQDAYGYRAGSMKSKAASLYAAKGGATLAEVKTALGSTQLNLLKDLEGRGFAVKRVKEAGVGKRQVTRYFLTTK